MLGLQKHAIETFNVIESKSGECVTVTLILTTVIPERVIGISRDWEIVLLKTTLPFCLVTTLMEGGLLHGITPNMAVFSSLKMQLMAVHEMEVVQRGLVLTIPCRAEHVVC